MTTKPREKVFVEILNQLKTIMLDDQLQPGDKLPSERELSERLNVGRSSVREALRAMELLGLIETRRGEGTFIKELKKHRLVEVLASFILSDTTAKKELAETRNLIEKNAITLASKRRTEEQVSKLKNLLSRMEKSNTDKISSALEWDFFKVIFNAAQNFLLYRLWIELNEYDDTSSKKEYAYELSDYKYITSLVQSGMGENQLSSIHRYQQ
ncbi:FadR/GntR family transcriptional regulator [Pseudalkalibacillus salsuginis]|uniref:FadR/GntR family transcriptional regulator n=1 Tax=Pseudalkalibacillus salsuginis TaxID=2910972 RepID=UPI001F2FC9A9|nr:GntR family transcriptional regulator [Pseudalkalibacillus salsuginis]MCF6408754.1 GntR family transcriptional regulator [Pseudalkalibacillus salsuginis]